MDDVSVSNIHIGSPATPEYSYSITFELVEECVNSLLASLAYLGDHRGVEILKLRYGLVDGHKWTLEEVGRKFGVSRERIRQLQAKTTRRLHRNAKHLHSSQIDQCVKELRSFADQVGENLLGKGFTQVFSTVSGMEEAIVSAYINLLNLTLAISDDGRQSLHEVDQCIVNALAQRSHPASIDELQQIIQSNPEASGSMADWPELDLSIRLMLVLHVEIDAHGFCTATERTLLGLNNTDRRLFILTRVLREEGRPLHFTEIARRARPLLGGKLAMSDRNVHAWMDRYKDYFKWAGPGIYGLAEWDIGVSDNNLEDGLRPARRTGIGDEIALILSEHNEPVSLSYVEDHILSRFEVNRASVYASITQDKANRFVLLEDGRVALSSWGIYSQISVGSDPKRRVRLPRDLRDTARSAARAKVSDLIALLAQGTATVTPAKATGHAVVAAALGMTREFQILLDIAEESNVPTDMVDALKDLSES